ncbi:helix-turn-helix domain-containing protein [Enterobacter cloacae subsp. cloacae]|uniref:helix-turn-helix domain-containing protein n=1 Tax=Enterobacter cloacae TaxID=550 RepID=UPI001C5B53C2|nr:helix-turn-helix domain-containing protein [Enterobacter cloacae]MBW4201882.1 helix-turn-helix domain-containing protein [Enterobacter cloacae subsp. cloacae]
MNTAYRIKHLNQLRPILIGFRKVNGLTQKEISQRLGVTQQAYARLESSPASASFERLFRVFAALGIELTLSSLQHSTPAPSGDVEDNPARREIW